MNIQEMVIFNRIIGYGINEVTAINGARRESSEHENFTGTEVIVRKGEVERDYFFPDYAGMSDAEMAEVIANNLKEELWNSLNESTRP